MSDVKELLLSARDAAFRLSRLRERRAMYMDMAFSLGGGNLDGMPHGNGNRSKVQTAAIRLADIDTEITKAIVECVEDIVTADKLIQNIRNTVYRDMLYRRYICGQSWKTIEEEMNYTDRRNMFRTHGKALTELRKFV